MLKISIACDHGGFEKKEELKKHLSSLNYEVIDCGTSSIESCDYPLFAEKAAEYVASGTAKFGIVICTTGEGVCITANKVKGIRCGIGYNDDVAVMLRRHNDANMIAFSAKYNTLQEMKDRIELFLSTQFDGGRHQRRVDEISAIEK